MYFVPQHTIAIQRLKLAIQRLKLVGNKADEKDGKHTIGAFK